MPWSWADPPARQELPGDVKSIEMNDRAKRLSYIGSAAAEYGLRVVLHRNLHLNGMKNYLNSVREQKEAEADITFDAAGANITI